MSDTTETTWHAHIHLMERFKQRSGIIPFALNKSMPKPLSGCRAFLVSSRLCRVCLHPMSFPISWFWTCPKDSADPGTVRVGSESPHLTISRRLAAEASPSPGPSASRSPPRSAESGPACKHKGSLVLPGPLSDPEVLGGSGWWNLPPPRGNCCRLGLLGIGL